jgi:uncharacterized protein involved in exopolysaccharide biosynthesis
MMQTLLTPGVRDALAIVRHHRYRVATAALAAMLIASAVAVTMPSRYTAAASLLVKFGREYVYRPEVGAPPSFQSTTRTNEIVNAEIQILRARELKEQVVTTLSPAAFLADQGGALAKLLASWRDSFYASWAGEALTGIGERLGAWERDLLVGGDDGAKSFGPVEEAVLELDRGFKVQGIKDSPVIEISYTNQNPEMAARVLQLMIDGFTEKRLKIYSEPQLPFLHHQIRELHGKLSDAEKALQTFKSMHDIYSIDEQMRLLLVRESEFEARMKEDSARLGEIGRRMAAIDQQMREVPKTVVLNAETDTRQVRDAEQMLLTLSLKEQQLLVRYVDAHPVVQDLRKEIGQVRRFLEEQKKDQAGRVITGRNDNYVKLEYEQLALDAERQSLRDKAALTERQLAQIRQQIQKVGLQQRELRELERETSLHERAYEAYRVKAEEERATAALDEERRTSVRVIQSPVSSALPAGIPKWMKVLLAGIFGALAGCGAVLFLEGRRPVFYSAQAVESRLGVPVLLALPDLRGSRQ